MAEKERPLYTLYKGLKANNFDVPDNYDSFEKTLTEAGNGGANSRHTLYNSLKEQNFDVPDTYERFYSNLFTPVNKTTSRALGGSVPMSDADKARFSRNAAAISAQAGQAVQRFKNTQRASKNKQRQKKRRNDFGRVDLGTSKTAYGTDNAVRDEFGIDPATGKVGTYITSSGEEIGNEYEAGQQQQTEDKYNAAYNEAVEKGEIPSAFDVVDKNGNYDLYENVGKNGTHVTEEGARKQLDAKIADATARLSDINARIKEIDARDGNPLLSYSASIGGGSGASDERRQLGLARNQVEKELRSLDAIQKQPDRNWLQNMGQGFADTALTANAWDFGLNDFAVMGQLERIKSKVDNNIPLTNEEKRLAQSKIGADAAAALADDEMGKAYRWSGIAGQSVPFMFDFLVTGGFGGLTHAAGKAAVKYAAKKGMGTLGKNVLKYTGVTAANIVGSYAMAGTEQFAKTGADIMNRHMGTLYQDENGNYAFGTFDDNGNLVKDGGEGFGTALYKGLTAAMLENYTEKVFRHTHFKRAASKALSSHFPKFASFMATKGAPKWMKGLGIDGLGEEIMEEEINIPLNALLVGDNKLSDLGDIKQQGDIIFGIGLSVGSMYALNAVPKGAAKVYNHAQYYRFKNKMDNVDNSLQQMMGDRWSEWKDRIDNTPNEEMGAVINDVLQQKQSGSLNEQEINTIGDYISNLAKVRGYNLAKTTEMDAKAATGEETTPEDERQQEQEQAYAEGQDAEGEEKHEIQMQTAEAEGNLASILGVSEEQLENMDLDSLLGENDQLDLAIYEYQNASARYQGVMDKAQSAVDAAEENARAEVQRRMDTSRGTVRNATIKSVSNDLNGGEDYGVYIVSGNLVANEDGTINVSDSDDMILYFDPLSGKIEHGDASRFASLGEEVDAEQTIQQTAELARQDAIAGVTRDIDGKVGEGSQFVVIDNQGQQHVYEVLADNGDGTASVSIDGNVIEGAYPTFEELQKMKDDTDNMRVANSVATRQAERQQQQIAEQQQQQQAEQQVNSIDFSQLIDPNGTITTATIEGEEDKLGFVVGYTPSGKLRIAYLNDDGSVEKRKGLVSPDKVMQGEPIAVDEYKQMMGEQIAEQSTNAEVVDDSATKEVVDSGTVDENAAEQVADVAPAEEETKQAPTFSDGTPIPLDKDGEADFSQMRPEQAVEWYDTNLGEDAQGVIDANVASAKKALDKAQNVAVKPAKPSEMVKARQEKQAAIDAAQTAYDNAVAVSNAYNEMQLNRSLATPEGRKTLLDKAKVKYDRLKNKDEWKNNQQALWNDAVGNVLHRLYDNSSVNVFDHEPQTMEEYVSNYLVPFSLNYEGTDTSKGVKQETGLERKDFAKSHVLAAEGKGKTVDDFVHQLWENRPSQFESATDQDVRNALLDLITSDMNAYDMRHVIENNRIAQAEKMLEDEKSVAENAAYQEEQSKNTPSEEASPSSETSATEEQQTEEKATETQLVEEQPEENTAEEQQTAAPSDNLPFGEQLSENDLPFSPNDGNQVVDSEERKKMVDKNKVTVDQVSEAFIPKKLQRGIARIAKMMPKIDGKPLKVQYLYSADADGWFDRDTNTLYLALDSSKALQMVFGHEMTHAIKSMNTSAYDELKGLVKEFLGTDFDKAVDATEKFYNAHGVNYTNKKDYEEEVIADGIGTIINDLNLTKGIALRMSHPLLAAFHDVLMKIRLAFRLSDDGTYEMLTHAVRTIEKAYVDTAKGTFNDNQGESGEHVAFSLREKPEPKKKGIGYKVFLLKDGKLYPPMVANPNGAATPVGVWLDADAAPIAGESKTGRPQVKQGGKGTQGGSGMLAYRPGWHLGVIPYALQFNRKDAEGNKTLFPKNFVFAEVEYAADVDYQQEAHDAGINPSGKYQHSLAGLKHLPTDGYYMYRTNPNPETDPWVITGAMKVNRILTRAEQADLVKKAGRTPQSIQDGDIVTDDVVAAINKEIADAPKFSIRTYHGSQASFDHFDHSFMGSGEGAQAYGWGTYVSEVEGIAKAYAKQNAKKHTPSKFTYKGEPMSFETPTTIYQVALDMDKYNISAKEAISKMIDANEKKLSNVDDTPFGKIRKNQIQSVLNLLKGLNPSDFSIEEDYDTIAQNLANTKSGLSLLENELKDANSYVDLYSTRLEDAQKELAKAKESGTGLGVDMYESDVAYYSEQVKKYKDKVKTKEGDIEDVKAKVDALQKKLDSMEKPRNLYTVEIPDDNGDNYIDWDGKVSDNAAMNIAKGIVAKDIDAAIDMFEKYGNFIVRDEVKQLHDRKDEIKKDKLSEKLGKAMSGFRGGAVYEDLANVLGGQKDASLMLKDAGIDGVKVIAQRNTGGNKQGRMNYVIFDENNAKIVNHEKFSLRSEDFPSRLKSAISETDVNPSEAQKKSGNYKKGHIKFGGYDFTIENPKDSERKGVDKDGKEWSVKMHDTYGYIRGKIGKDGDHLDMFINDSADLDNWNGNVYVVDQVNEDGSFDEHKVMYGYDSVDEAKKSYLANYSKGWKGLGNITGVDKETFDKWLDSSNRKTKPFADYRMLDSIKPVGVGAFGNIYNQFRGKAKEAINFLKKLGGGEATAALHHHTIGDISLVWGDKKTGLAKILRKHPEVVDNLQSIIDSMEVVSETDNRIKLESPTHFAVVSKEFKGEPREKWLLTAYEKKESLANGKSMDTATTSLGGDTALSQTKDSAAKIVKDFETSKENGEKFSLRDEQIHSEQFKDWFGDWEKDPKNASKVVDENGEPLVVYHGTTNDETRRVWNEKAKSYDTSHEPFTVFKREVDGLPNSGLFFNSSENNAYEYGYNNYAVYLNAKNPLVIDCKGSLYNSIRHDGKTMDTYDWANWAEENGYDGVIFKNIKDGVDYGSMQDTTDDYVVFKSNQIKSATDNNGDFSSKNKDIRFSLKDPDKTMFGMHNISVDKLRKAIKQGGFAAPSMGVVDSKNGVYSDYGEITLIPKAEKLDKRKGKNAGTFTADAWTPTYPNVSLKASADGEQKIDRDTYDNKDMDDDMGLSMRDRWTTYLRDGGKPIGVAYQFLSETGKKPKLVKYPKEYPASVVKALKSIYEKGGRIRWIEDYTDDEFDTLANIYKKWRKDSGLDVPTEEELKDKIAAADERIATMKDGDLKDSYIDYTNFLKKHGLTKNEVDNWMNKVMQSSKKQGQVNVRETNDLAIKKVTENPKLSAEFNKWFDSKLEEYGVNEYLYNGMTPSGKRKYVPNTVENAVKIMKKQGVVGGYNDFAVNVGTFIAHLAPSANTLAAMKKNKDKLIPFGDERHGEMRKQITSEFQDLGSILKINPNDAWDDSGMYRMQELAEVKPRDLKKYIADNWNKEVSDGWVERYNELVDTIKNDYPVYYFETKFMRPYGLDEFEKAIVPKDTPKDVLDALKNAGIDVHTYNNKKDREKVTMDAVTGSDGIMFSLKSMADGSEYASTSLANKLGELTSAKKVDDAIKEAVDNMPSGWKMANKKAIHVAEALADNRKNEIVGNTKFSLRYPDYEKALSDWKKRNGLAKDAKRPEMPQQLPNESKFDFMKRVNKYLGEKALWNTAPTYEGHLLYSNEAVGYLNSELQRGSVLARIAVQDSMLPIRKAQEGIMRQLGLDKIGVGEDAYTAENRSHGKAKNEFEEYNQVYLQPLRKAYHTMKKALGDSYDNVKVYMMSKHGLERNAVIAFRDALKKDFTTKEKGKKDVFDADGMQNAYNGYKSDVARIMNDANYAAGTIDYATYRQNDDAIRTKYAPSYPEFRYDDEGNLRDYAGLSALYSEAPDFEVAAAENVRNVENAHGAETTALWDATNAATKKILKDSYQAGMMSKGVYDYVRDMYSNYIPLRGWDGTSADQVWNYVGGGRGAFNQAMKKAEGRKSIADDPIAYIENMAESGILLNNKNYVKQHLLLLAENHPTKLLTVSKAWYVKSKDAFGNDIWTIASPNIPADMTDPEKISQAIAQFEKDMRDLEAMEEATQKRGRLDIEYPQTHGEEREHEVRVLRDGEEYVIYVNGDPQLAQAMNNVRAQRVRENQSGVLDRSLAWLGRKMAAAYTSLSPLFIPANFTRDLTMTLASTAIREDGRYNYLLRKNFATNWNSLPLVMKYHSGKLRQKVEDGTATKTEQMFYDFMMNGGETGFVSTMEVEDFKKKIQNDLKDMDRVRVNPKRIGHAIMDSIELLNRAIEDSNRFLVYMTSIEYGRPIEEAVNNAKDVTLNFNRKGTDEYGWQMVRNLYLFINPAIQSLQTLGALAKHNPYKFTAVTSLWLASGVLVPAVNNLLLGMFGGDDDKDKYWSFSKWDRRNNFIMWIPFTKDFIKIPLAQEFRGFYSVGDMIASKLMGGDKATETWGDYAQDFLGQVVDMLPLDPTGYDGNVAVSLMPNAIRPFFELAFNVDFTGKPLFKDSEFNKYDPNFTKAYAGTPDWLVRTSRLVNSLGNPYPDVQQNAIDRFGDPRYNLNNPAVVDHVLSSYLGGAYTFGSQAVGVLTKALNSDSEIKTADIPLLSRFAANPDDRPVAKKQGDVFWNMKEQQDRTKNTLSKLKKEAKASGDFSTLEGFYQSEQYAKYKENEPKIKQYEEDKKKENAEKDGDEYKPHKTTGGDIYKRHATSGDDFEDMKMDLLWKKVSGFKTAYDGMVALGNSQSETYYRQHSAVIDAADEASTLRSSMNDLKKGMLTDDGKDGYNAKDMKEIRELRKQAISILENAVKTIQKGK